MKKHLYIAVANTVLLLCGTQSSTAAGFNPNAAPISAHSVATNHRGNADSKYNAEARTLLGELKTVLAALQHDVAAMKTGSESVAAQMVQVKTALDRVETHVNAVPPPRNNVWLRGPRRSGP